MLPESTFQLTGPAAGAPNAAGLGCPDSTQLSQRDTLLRCGKAHHRVHLHEYP